MYWKLSLAVVAAGVLAMKTFGASEVMERTFEVKPGGTLRMKVDRGNIRVTGAKAGKVEVRVERELKRASESKAREVFEAHRIEFDQSGDSVEIRAENGQGLRRFARNPFNNLQVTYTVSVPSEYNVDVNTSGGNVELSQLEGMIAGRTSGGNVSLSGGHGDADLQTSGGNIRVEELEGNATVRTSGGNIVVDSVTGTVDAQTSGGDVRVAEVKGAVRARTSGGNVSAELLEAPKTNCALKTSGGNISLSLPSGATVDVEARTSGGRVQSDFDGEYNKQRTRFSGALNGGGPNIALDTSGGDVSIRRK